MEDKEFLEYLKSHEGINVLLELYLFDYIQKVANYDEDAFQEIILKLLEDFKRNEYAPKKYNLLKYYKGMIHNWCKNYKAEKNGLYKKGEGIKISKILKKHHTELSDKDFLDLEKFRNIKNTTEIEENSSVYESTEDDIILKIELENRLNKFNERELKIFEMRRNNYTFKEIGEVLNCSNQNICKIFKKMVGKI